MDKVTKKKTLKWKHTSGNNTRVPEVSSFWMKVVHQSSQAKQRKKWISSRQIASCPTSVWESRLDSKWQRGDCKKNKIKITSVLMSDLQPTISKALYGKFPRNLSTRHDGVSVFIEHFFCAHGWKKAIQNEKKSTELMTHWCQTRHYLGIGWCQADSFVSRTNLQGKI